MTEGKTVKIRASSLPMLFDCAARWEATQIRKLRLPRRANAQMGTAVHSGTALYDQARLDGQNLTPNEAAGAVVDAIHQPGEEVVWDDLNKGEAEKIAVALHNLYCEQIAPTQDYVAVEALCDELSITDLGLTLTGTTDRIRRAPEGGLGIVDIKTGKNAVNAEGRVKTGGHAFQLGVYELLAQAAIGQPIEAPAQIVGLQAAKTSRGRRAAIGEVYNPKQILIGAEDEPGLLVYAAGIIKSGRFPGNPNSLFCHEKYCPVFGTCRFRA